jgi:hypothetical protein
MGRDRGRRARAARAGEILIGGGSQPVGRSELPPVAPNSLATEARGRSAAVTPRTGARTIAGRRQLELRRQFSSEDRSAFPLRSMDSGSPAEDRTACAFAESRRTASVN